METLEANMIGRSDRMAGSAEPPRSSGARGPHSALRTTLRAASLFVMFFFGGLLAREAKPDLGSAQWIWTEANAHKRAEAGTRYFRTTFTVAPEDLDTDTTISVSCDNLFKAYLNGTLVCENDPLPDSWRRPRAVAVGGILKSGLNTLAVEGTNTLPGAAGLVVKLIGGATAEPTIMLTSDAEWRGSEKKTAGWQAPEFDDGQWSRVRVLGPFGMAPWGDLGLPTTAAAGLDLTQTGWFWTTEGGAPIGSFSDGARYFRASLTVPDPLPHGRIDLIVAADNLFTLYVNGKRIGRGTEWTRAARFDITRRLVPGRNQLAVLAINTLPGPAGVLAVAVESRRGRAPAILPTDSGWKSHAEPFPGWQTAEFDDSSWPPARVLAAFGTGPWGTKSRIPPAPEKLWVFPVEEDFTDPLYEHSVVFVQGAIRIGSVGQNFIQNIGVSRAYTEFDTPSPSALGQRLCRLTPFRPDGTVTVLADAGGGLLGSPSVSYDGARIFFTMAREGESYFHVFRVDADGNNPRQVTAGPFHDFDPAELPDGRIVFASTRGGTAEEYHAVASFSLFTANADGSDIRPLTRHIVGDREPRVTADGALVFVRCDNFMERAKVETHIHRTRLDGSGGEIVIGPDRAPITYFPASGAEASSAWLRVYGAGCPTPLPDGRIAAITERGVVVSSRRRGEIPGAYMPYDMSALPDGRLLCTAHDRSRLCILDPSSGKVTEVVDTEQLGLFDGNWETTRKGYVWEDIHSAQLLAPRPTPPARPNLVNRQTDDPAGETGFLYCQNVRNTRHTSADVQRIRAIRVFEGRPFSLVPTQTIYAHIGTEGRELGTVPLAPDGSFYIEVPADRAIALQAVDAEGRSIINELSWIYVRPGERRACTGCHAPTGSSPPPRPVAAARAAPLRFPARGAPHRFRANNAANGGILNMQFSRFREAANINLFTSGAAIRGNGGKIHPASRSADREQLGLRAARSGPDLRLSAVQRLAVFRDRENQGVLLAALAGPTPEIRAGAALGLAACGGRGALPGLVALLADPHPAAAQAAHVALEHLTCLNIPFDAFGNEREKQTDAWKRALETLDWTARESRLCAALKEGTEAEAYAAAEALGHVGAERGAAALRTYLTGHPDGNLRPLLAIMRALGQLGDRKAVSLLASILEDNMLRTEGKGNREFGAAQRPVYLAAGAAEALGRIGTERCAEILLQALPRLRDSSRYASACGDHGWLVGCHTSPLHYRILEALDRMQTARQTIPVATILRSLPMDKDRALLYEYDGYETLAARVVLRSGRAGDVVETCLAVLGETGTTKHEDLLSSIITSPHAERHIRKHTPQARAAQILSIVCVDPEAAPACRRRLRDYLRKEPSETRSWVCFMLIRTLAHLRDRQATGMLVQVLTDEPTEAAGGTIPPPNHWVYKTMKPFFRAAAAYALGEIGDPGSGPVLLNVLDNLDNAPAVRRQSAVALGKLADDDLRKTLRQRARFYPDLATRYALLAACAVPTGEGNGRESQPE